MKGLLLKTNTLDEMIRVGTLEGMVELLQKTGYKQDLAGASVDYSGTLMIEIAASKNFSRVVKKLIRITPSSDRKVLQAMLIRWDLLNLKTMMHAKRIRKTYDEVRPYLFEVGSLTEDNFKRIMKADESSLLRELRRTELGKKMLSMGTGQLSKKMHESFTNAFRNLDTFMQMETVIDAYTYMFMDESLSEMGGGEASAIRKILRRETDAKNVMIIERLKKHNIDRDKIMGSLIRGGTLNDSTLNKVMDAKDIPAVVALIKPKFRKLELKSDVDVGITDLEIAFEKSITAQKVLAFNRSTLSVGVIVGFLLLKEEEVNNLRKIAKGKAFGLSESEVRDMIVNV
jgi:V/A-type H+-transporting ATPase subunit C